MDSDLIRAKILQYVSFPTGPLDRQGHVEEAYALYEPSCWSVSYRQMRTELDYLIDNGFLDRRSPNGCFYVHITDKGRSELARLTESRPTPT